MKEVIRGTLVTSIQDLDSLIQEAKEGKEVEALCFDKEFRQELQVNQTPWEQVFAKLLEAFPDLKHLSLLNQEIADNSLHRLKEFKALQGFAFSYSKTSYKEFLQDLPSSIQYLELSNLPLETFNQNLEVAALLNRLEYLQTLDLSSTYLVAIPKLVKLLTPAKNEQAEITVDNPHMNLKKLIFCHREDSRVYPYFSLKDLELIESNFPMLEELNIQGVGFLPKSSRLCKVLEAFSSRESFVLHADSPLDEYFKVSQSKNPTQENKADELSTENINQDDLDPLLGLDEDLESIESNRQKRFETKPLSPSCVEERGYSCYASIKFGLFPPKTPGRATPKPYFSITLRDAITRALTPTPVKLSPALSPGHCYEEALAPEDEAYNRSMRVF